MNKTDRRYQMYLDILQEELLPALGCTEPIAVAYAAANARSVLPGAPERLGGCCQQQYCQKRKKRHCSEYRRSERNSGCGSHRRGSWKRKISA